MNDKRIFIDDDEFVTVTKMGHLIEVQHMEHMNRECPIVRLDKDNYMVIATGEIKQYNHIEDRSQSINSLRQTFKKLRYLINNNFEGKSNELFITLTYAENMTDTERLYKDFDKFIKKMKYHYGKLEYINVVEPQQRGAWHCHVLMKFVDKDSVFIPSDDIATNWGQGFVKVKSLKDVDNIGAYVSAYLADIELDENNIAEMAEALDGNSVVFKEVDGVQKKFIKGGRLHLYPVDMKLYRASRGIKKPDRVRVPYKAIKKVVGAATPNYSKSYTIESEDFSNTITFEQYNLKRPNRL